MIKINLIFFRLKSTSVKERKGSIVALGGFLTVIILPQWSFVMVNDHWSSQSWRIPWEGQVFEINQSPHNNHYHHRQHHHPFSSPSLGVGAFPSEGWWWGGWEKDALGSGDTSSTSFNSCASLNCHQLIHHHRDQHLNCIMTRFLWSSIRLKCKASEAQWRKFNLIPLWYILYKPMIMNLSQTSRVSLAVRSFPEVRIRNGA